MPPDPLSKVLPDKVRHLEARVARLEDTVGMLEKSDRRLPIGLNPRETRILASSIAVAVLAMVVVVRIRERSTHAL